MTIKGRPVIILKTIIMQILRMKHSMKTGLHSQKGNTKMESAQDFGSGGMTMDPKWMKQPMIQISS